MFFGGSSFASSPFADPGGVSIAFAVNGVGLEVASEGQGILFSAFNDAQLSTAQSKFGVSSLLLDGTNDYVESTSDVDLTSGDLTIDMWIRPDSVTGYHGLWQSGTGANIYSAYLIGNKVQLTVNGSTIIFQSSTAISTGVWTMLSFEREGNTHRLYINGTLEETGSTPNRPDDGLFNIGENGFGDFDGYIDEVRVSDIARYEGSSFTEPTSEFSVDSDTIALLHFDGADGSTDMINAVNEESLVLENNIGEETAFTDVAVSVTGQELTISIGEETIQANADVDVSGINITSFIGQVDQNTSYSVTGNDLTISLGNEGTIGNANVDATGTTLTSSVGSINITAWSEIDPGVSNTWTDVDLAA